MGVAGGVMTTYDLYQVPHFMVEEYFPLVQDNLLRAMKACNSDESLEQLRRKLISGLAQLWIVSRDNVAIVASGTTEILNANSGARILQITTLGGADLEQWMHLWPKMEVFAKAEKCDKVRLHGRRGWQKIMKDYHEPWVTLEKAI